LKSFITIKINFRGGIISPGDLNNILFAVGKWGVTKVKFGLRQQLLIDVTHESFNILKKELDLLRIRYEVDKDEYPNVVSSYPAEEVFITHTWLSEGVYKDIFDLMDYQPKLKINISNSNQSFTPLFTGNINWVAAPEAPHFWYLFIRFPKTNVVYEWKDLVYTNDVVRMSRHIEALIFQYPEKFYDNPNPDGESLYTLAGKENYITKPVEAPAKLPSFNLPYYEGLNRYQDKYWLGIYRRDESFSVNFLLDLCDLCLKTKIGQLCSTPWKSIIVKSIEEKDRPEWNSLLAKHLINVRHAANELNFQVEDNCKEGLQLKNYLLGRLHKNDTRTFGICIGIKTRKKSEVFSSILVRKRPLISIAGFGLLHVYDILCAKDFNPNERTGSVFSRGNPKFLLTGQLHRAIFSFYTHRINLQKQLTAKPARGKVFIKPLKAEFAYQCKHCLTVYEENTGDPEKGIAAAVSFEQLPGDYCCPLCESGKDHFIKIDKNILGLQTV